MAIEEKPSNPEEYKEWLVQELKVDNLGHHETHYKSATPKILSDFKGSAVWVRVTQFLGEIASDYYARNDYLLFAGGIAAPELEIKPFDSFLLKTYRRNVLNNRNWPDPPQDGWLTPDNWFSQINDIVRTSFVVKYLDGVEYLASKIQEVCQENAVGCDLEFRALEEGYYAAHINVVQNCEIPLLTWETQKLDIQIEIQITTQLQEVIRKLLHKHYEERRLRGNEEPSTNWQWDYKSEEFSTNYLGHILHYIEGMIMDVRERRNG